jgi:hypothetical protein
MKTSPEINYNTSCAPLFRRSMIAAMAAAAAVVISLAPLVRADRLAASDLEEGDSFGYSVSISGDSILAGAIYDDDNNNNSGSAYYYKAPGLGGTNGTVNESVKLLASDGARNDDFGNSVSLSGDNALVAAFYDDDKGDNSGSAYYYKELDNVSGNNTGHELPGIQNATKETVKLLASDGAAGDWFGYSTSLSADSALVGAYLHASNGEVASGAAYYYKDLDNVSGNKTNHALPHVKNATYETVKLLASDGAKDDWFGQSVSLSGDSEDNALVGARYGDGKESDSGAAYYYKGLDNREEGDGNPVYETFKLLASDGATDDRFGQSVSLSADSALVGAYGADDKADMSGAAYYYKGLDSHVGSAPVTETVKLLASDGTTNDYFGESVSLSGDNALVGARYNDDHGSSSGSAYYYKELDNVSGNNTGLDLPNVQNATYETVKLIASDGATGDYFGLSVSLSGDRFVIGAYRGYVGVEDVAVRTGKTYAGDIRAFTTLDAAGGAALATGGLTFVSQGDWIIGQNNSDNQVTLSKVWSSNATNPAGAWFQDAADVTATGKAVYIGKEAGAANNTLLIEGILTANDIYIGAAGNSGNALIVAGGGEVNNARLHIGGAGTNTVTVESTGLITATALSVVIDSAADYGSVINDGSFIFLAGATLDVVLNYIPVAGAVFDLVTGSGDITNDSESLANGMTFIAANGVEFGIISDGSRFALVVSAAAVPEPATWAMFAGVVLLAWTAMRRRSPA